MSYKCLECSHIFDECEIRTTKEIDGYSYGCPVCDGDFEQTYRCAMCGGEFLDSELNGTCISGICDECLDSFRHDFGMCFEISQESRKEQIKLNALLATLLSEEEIEYILLEYIGKNYRGIDCSDFIDADSLWFGAQAADRYKRKIERERRKARAHLLHNKCSVK